MIRWAADALLILLATFLLLFAFAVIDGVIGALWDAWKQRKRVNRREWWNRDELEQLRAREREPESHRRMRALADAGKAFDEQQRFKDQQVSRYLRREKW